MESDASLDNDDPRRLDVYKTFRTWKLEIAKALVVRDLSNIVTGEEEPPKKSQFANADLYNKQLALWEQKDMAARNILLHHCNNGMLQNVQSLSRSRFIWKYLEATYGKPSRPLDRVSEIQDLCHVEYNGNDIHSFLAEFEARVCALKLSSPNPNDTEETFLGILLQKIEPCFETFARGLKLRIGLVRCRHNLPRVGAVLRELEQERNISIAMDSLITESNSKECTEDGIIDEGIRCLTLASSSSEKEDDRQYINTSSSDAVKQSDEVALRYSEHQATNIDHVFSSISRRLVQTDIASQEITKTSHSRKRLRTASPELLKSHSPVEPSESEIVKLGSFCSRCYGHPIMGSQSLSIVEADRLASTRPKRETTDNSRRRSRRLRGLEPETFGTKKRFGSQSGTSLMPLNRSEQESSRNGVTPGALSKPEYENVSKTKTTLIDLMHTQNQEARIPRRPLLERETFPEKMGNWEKQELLRQKFAQAMWINPNHNGQARSAGRMEGRSVPGIGAVGAMNSNNNGTIETKNKVLPPKGGSIFAVSTPDRILYSSIFNEHAPSKRLFTKAANRAGEPLPRPSTDAQQVDRQEMEEIL